MHTCVQFFLVRLYAPVKSEIYVKYDDNVSRDGLVRWESDE